MNRQRVECAFTGIVAAVLLLSVFVPVPKAEAQVLYGSIIGNVTDPSGGVIGGATVQITNRGTGQSSQAVTNVAGLYQFQNVTAGTYDLTVTHPGFTTYTTQNIILNVNTVQRHNVTLQVGQVAETVTVEASVVALQTDRADVSHEVTSAVITELPLPRYRNFQSLINLVPGATPARFQNANTDSPQRSLATNVNGTSRRNNSTRIDGTLTMQLQLSHAMYIPSAETIEVVNINTNAADAEQGLAGGSSITLTTKSGTNELHGSAYWYNQNNALMAKDFFFRDPKTPKNIVNIGGFTVGGPIKKDKLFFFGGLETIRERTNFSLLYTLPTEDQRRGDFSAYGTTIYDPATGDALGRGRTPFPNRIIPQNRLHPISLKMQSLIPATNQPGVRQNFFNSGTDVTDRDQIDIKINYNRNPTHMMFLKWGWMDANISGIGGLGEAQGQCLCTGGATGDGSGDTMVNTATFGQTKTFSPNFVWDMALGWSREAQVVAQTLRGTNYARDVLGIPGTNGGDINQSGHIRIDISPGYSGLGNFDNWMPAERFEMVYTMTQNFSYMKGSHNIRFGFEGIHNRLNHFQPGPATQGHAMFTGGPTQINGGPAATQFNGWASYLLGAVNTWQKGLQWERPYAQDWQLGLYFRDRWQVSPKLTLNYGLRWEKYPMMRRMGAHHSGIENWDPETNLVALGGNGSNPLGLGITTSNRLFTPRLGIAYRMRDNLVIRTGYGINIDPQPFLGWNRAQWPSSITGRFEPANTFVPFNYFDQGIPDIFGPPAGIDFTPADPRANITYFPGDMVRRMYIQSWNFTVEGRLPGDTVLSVGYVGTQQTRLRTSLEVSPARPGTGQAGRPLFQQWGRIANTNFSDGMSSSNYHSLQTAVNRRVGAGLTLKGAYTWSHALGMASQTAGAINFRLPEMMRRNYTNTEFDIRHNLQMGFIYDMPFGRGKRYATSGLASHLLGDWQLNGIFVAYTGRPFDITASAAACNCPGAFGTFTADLVDTNVRKLGTPDQWYDTSSFGVVNRRTGTIGDFGNMNQRVMRAPGMVNMDLSLFRDFPLSEQFRLQFRGEAFNISNTPHFNPPNGNVNAADFMVIASSFGSRFAQDAGNRLFRLGLRLSW
jgi:hypothetical protein